MIKPSVYVGTYAKYNSGSIQGAWLDLTKYSDNDEFIAACKLLHNDELDPEFMIQDFEGFPKMYYSESGLNDELFDFLALDDDDKKMLAAFIECFGDESLTIDQARDAFFGEFSSDLDFAYDYIESTCYLSGCPDSIQNYFDYDKFARDLMFDFTESNGFYFSNNW